VYRSLLNPLKTFNHPCKLFEKDVLSLSDAEMGVLIKYQKVYDYVYECERVIISLQEENKRLKYENEFMLRLVEGKENE